MAEETQENQGQGQKHAGGRPRILQSLEVAENLIELYFKNEPAKPTICGLALHLGFCDRQSITDYIKRNDEFSCIIKKACARIEQRHEERLYEEKPTGSIFWLKNRGWKDSHDLTSGGEKIHPTVVSFLDAINPKPEDQKPESTDDNSE